MKNCKVLQHLQANRPVILTLSQCVSESGKDGLLGIKYSTSNRLLLVVLNNNIKEAKQSGGNINLLFSLNILKNTEN